MTKHTCGSFLISATKDSHALLVVDSVIPPVLTITPMITLLWYSAMCIKGITKGYMKVGTEYRLPRL